MSDTVKKLTGLRQCEFNAQCYSNRYPDLQTAFRGDATQLLNHWNNFGKREGRIPCCDSITDADPSVDVSIQFPTGVTNSVPATCSTILGAARRSGTKDLFLSTYKLNEMKNNLDNFRNKLLAPGVDQFKTVDSSPGYQDIDTYLTTIERTQLPVQRLVSQCLSEELEVDVASKQEEMEESKSRYESIKAPEQSVSYYEGWFPLFRPMKESSLFTLFGISLGCLLVSILLFLRMRGVEIKILMPETFGIAIAPYTTYLYSATGIGVLLAFLGHFYFRWY